MIFVLGLMVIICIIAIISLNKQVRDLRGKMRIFYDEYQLHLSYSSRHPKPKKQTIDEKVNFANHSNELSMQEENGGYQQNTHGSGVPAQENQQEPLMNHREDEFTTPLESKPTYMDKFIEWFKIDWPMKIGGMVFILGVGWFLIFAIQNNWINPAMRITLSIAVSLAMVGFGRYKIASQPIQGSYLVGLGSAVYVLSIFIGYKFFGFFGITIGLLMIAAQYALMSYLSIHYRNHRLNDVGLFFSMICPWIFTDGSNHYGGLFGYLTIHIIGNMIVSYRYNRDQSRLVGLIYVVCYIILGLLGSIQTLGSGSLVPIVLALLFVISMLEVWIGRTGSRGFTRAQLSTLAIAGVTIISYITLLVYQTSSVVSPMIYTSLCAYFGVGYLTLWYMFSINNKQNVYSSIVGIFAIIFLGAIAYYHLSGISLLLVSIVMSAIIQAFAVLVTRDADTARTLSVGWIIPIILLVYNYDVDGVSSGYLISLYTAVGLLGGLGILYHQLIHQEKGLGNGIIIASVLLFYFALCKSFDGTSRIVALEVVSLFIALAGTHFMSSKVRYLQLGLLSIIIPASFILSLGISQNITLFGLMIALVVIAGVFIKFIDALDGTLDTTHRNMYLSMVSCAGVLLYLSLPYLIQSDYYTLSYTIVGMLIYLVGTRHRNPFQIDKLGYSSVLLIPIIVSFGLLDLPHTALVVLSTLSLSTSIIRIISDNKSDPRMHHWTLYLYTLIGLVYLWWGGYVLTRSISNADSAIVAMLIIFTIIGIGCYVYGKLHDDAEYRTIGTAIIIAMIARVFTVELWMMTLIMKIITCLVIGGLLVSSGFIGNQRNMIDKDKDSDLTQ